MIRTGSERVATGSWCRGERVRVVETATDGWVVVEVMTGPYAGWRTRISVASLEAV